MPELLTLCQGGVRHWLWCCWPLWFGAEGDQGFDGCCVLYGSSNHLQLVLCLFVCILVYLFTVFIYAIYKYELWLMIAYDSKCASEDSK